MFITRARTSEAQDKIERLVGSEVQIYEEDTLEEALHHLRYDVAGTWGDEVAEEVTADMLTEVSDG